MYSLLSKNFHCTQTSNGQNSFQNFLRCSSLKVLILIFKSNKISTSFLGQPTSISLTKENAPKLSVTKWINHRLASFSKPSLLFSKFSVAYMYYFNYWERQESILSSFHYFIKCFLIKERQVFEMEDTSSKCLYQVQKSSSQPQRQDILVECTVYSSQSIFFKKWILRVTNTPGRERGVSFIKSVMLSQRA